MGARAFSGPHSRPVGAGGNSQRPYDAGRADNRDADILGGRVADCGRHDDVRDIGQTTTPGDRRAAGRTPRARAGAQLDHARTS